MMIILVSIGAVGVFIFGLMVGCNRSFNEVKILEDRNLTLQEELEKLANHTLWMTGDKSLGGKIDMRLLPDRLPDQQFRESLKDEICGLLGPKDDIDRLLDIMESCEITKVTHLGDEIINPRRAVGVIHFGNVCLRAAGDGEYSWTPDIMLDEVLLPRLTDAQITRAKAIFKDRMAKRAIESIKP